MSKIKVKTPSKARAKAIMALTYSLHERVDELYEAMMDMDDKESLKTIEEIQREMVQMRNNLIKE